MKQISKVTVSKVLNLEQYTGGAKTKPKLGVSHVMLIIKARHDISQTVFKHARIFENLSSDKRSIPLLLSTHT